VGSACGRCLHVQLWIWLSFSHYTAMKSKKTNIDKAQNLQSSDSTKPHRRLKRSLGNEVAVLGCQKGRAKGE